MTTAGDARRSVARIDGENSIFSRRQPATRETGLLPQLLGTLRTKIGYNLALESSSSYGTRWNWKVKKETPAYM